MTACVSALTSSQPHKMAKEPQKVSALPRLLESNQYCPTHCDLPSSLSHEFILI